MGIQIQIPNRLVIDFRDPAQVLVWSSVNDRVMGGMSTSQATATTEGMAFNGVVSFRIRVFGLLIADRQAGPFLLVMESIQAQF